MTEASSEQWPAGLVGGVAALRTNLTRVGAFNALAPRDPARRVGEGLAYGPDPKQSLDVYAPADAEGPLPVVIFFHGGGWHAGRRQEYGFVGRALASRGFVALVVGYRLVPQVRYPAFLEDAAAAARWAVDKAEGFGGDPRRLAFTGHSAGAYIALQLGLDTRYLKAAGVDPACVKAVAGLSGPYSFLPLKTPATTAAFSAAEDLEATQPVNYARADAPPAYLAHGGRDTSVSAGQTVRLGRALTAAGAVAEVRIFQELNHADPLMALSRPFRNKAPILDELSAFLNTHMG